VPLRPVVHLYAMTQKATSSTSWVPLLGDFTFPPDQIRFDGREIVLPPPAAMNAAGAAAIPGTAGAPEAFPPPPTLRV
jgi:hypothetical protein